MKVLCQHCKPYYDEGRTECPSCDYVFEEEDILKDDKLDRIVEQLLKQHSYSDCQYIAERLIERVKWLRDYEKENDYYGD